MSLWDLTFRDKSPNVSLCYLLEQHVDFEGADIFFSKGSLNSESMNLNSNQLEQIASAWKEYKVFRESRQIKIWLYLFPYNQWSFSLQLFESQQQFSVEQEQNWESLCFIELTCDSSTKYCLHIPLDKELSGQIFINKLTHGW